VLTIIPKPPQSYVKEKSTPAMARKAADEDYFYVRCGNLFGYIKRQRRL
jgi:hypothetical protein